MGVWGAVVKLSSIDRKVVNALSWTHELVSMALTVRSCKCLAITTISFVDRVQPV